MTFKWLVNLSSIDELRQKYKELLIKYHPDNNSEDTTSIMQEINSEYDYLIKKLKGESTSTYDDSSFSEDDFKNILNELAKLKANIVIEIVGTWIWVYGPGTKEIKNQLKELHFKWSPKKQKWHYGTSHHRMTKEVDMSFIRAKYGSTIFNPNEQEPLKAIN